MVHGGQTPFISKASFLAQRTAHTGSAGQDQHGPSFSALLQQPPQDGLTRLMHPSSTARRRTSCGTQDWRTLSGAVPATYMASPTSRGLDPAIQPHQPQAFRMSSGSTRIEVGIAGGISCLDTKPAGGISCFDTKPVRLVEQPDQSPISHLVIGRALCAFVSTTGEIHIRARDSEAPAVIMSPPHPYERPASGPAVGFTMI
mmetsp:Transcript_41959/g.89572  ORF Transcript_41959/g.89572 Transcript_41959/m.89572 type:complete len:201 (+) Transcript_41959:226-828(+)